MRWALIEPFLDDSFQSVLEIGVGQGALGCRLAERYRYIGLELDEQALAVARRRLEQGTLVHGDLDALAPEDRFDLVVATEVLEHYEDDVGALRLWRERLVPRGAVLLSVPAFPERFGPWDVKAGHFRRYERDGLAGTLRAAGFEPVAIRTYGFPLGNLLEASARRGRETAARGGVDVGAHGGERPALAALGAHGRADRGRGRRRRASPASLHGRAARRRLRRARAGYGLSRSAAAARFARPAPCVTT